MDVDPVPPATARFGCELKREPVPSRVFKDFYEVEFLYPNSRVTP
jgi:hypothetical protein